VSAAETVARILALVPWLLERPGASVAETAEAFGVDARTVLRDLDTVGYCGLPGLGGGDLFEVDVVEDRILVRMADELRRPLRLTSDEALRLVLAGESVSSALGQELGALRSALDKVRAAIGVPGGISVELEDDGTVWLATLRAAIEQQRQVRIRYRRRGDAAPADRTVHPWTLHVAHGYWYVEGRDERSGGRRSFRLDRIEQVAVLDDAAVPPDGPPEPPRYEPAPGDTTVELELDPQVRWLAEAVDVDEVEERADGGRRVVFRTDAPGWVRRLLLVAGPGARVIRPAELAEAVREEARRALARYEEELAPPPA
jgi:proteasome accessory factor C